MCKSKIVRGSGVARPPGLDFFAHAASESEVSRVVD